MNSSCTVYQATSAFSAPLQGSISSCFYHSESALSVDPNHVLLSHPTASYQTPKFIHIVDMLCVMLSQCLPVPNSQCNAGGHGSSALNFSKPQP